MVYAQTPQWRGVATPLTNFRDLGGLMVAGGVVRSDVVWRSDDPTIASTEELERLVARGLTTVIDLRSPEEAAFTGVTWITSLPVERCHLPLSDRMAAPEVLAAARLRGAEPRDVAEWYAEMFVSRAPTLVHGLQRVCDAPGATLFHCAAGKDRTGVFAGALLDTLGAEHEVIVSDYALTERSLAATRLRLAPVVDGILGVDRPKPPGSGASLGADPAIMRIALQILDERADGLSAVLDGAGLTPELRQALRTKLVTAP